METPRATATVATVPFTTNWLLVGSLITVHPKEGFQTVATVA